MKSIVNRHLFTQTGVDSGALTMHATAVHSFAEAGEYQVALLWNNETIRRFELIVDDSAEDTQLNIDLAALHLPAAHAAQEGHYMVKPGGHAVFYVSHGAGGYAVVVTQQPRGEQDKRAARGQTPPPFDSRELHNGDLFAVTLLRPGAYSMTNTLTRAKGEIIVAYPKRGSRLERSLTPLSVECTDKGFVPNRIELQPMQGIVFRVTSPSRIRIDLAKPDDGPQGPRSPRHMTWRKPLVPKRVDKSRK